MINTLTLINHIVPGLSEIHLEVWLLSYIMFHRFLKSFEIKGVFNLWAKAKVKNISHNVDN